MPTPGMALHELVQGVPLVHVPDITDDDVYRSGNAVRRRLKNLPKTRTRQQPKIGRPPRYKPEFAERAFDFALLGATHCRCRSDSPQKRRLNIPQV
jgi:hypothetical protein